MFYLHVFMFEFYIRFSNYAIPALLQFVYEKQTNICIVKRKLLQSFITI